MDKDISFEPIKGSGTKKSGYATLLAAQPIGAGAELVTIEADLTRGLVCLIRQLKNREIVLLPRYVTLGLNHRKPRIVELFFLFHQQACAKRVRITMYRSPYAT
jgi:hypothetical protein